MKVVRVTQISGSKTGPCQLQYGMLEIEPWSVMCKASTLPAGPEQQVSVEFKDNPYLQREGTIEEDTLEILTVLMA